MNLFYNYQEKIFNSLKILDKRKIIHIPRKLKSFTVELPPKNQKADISCNAAMILAKVNNISPVKLAEILKKHLLLNFAEFKSIEIAGPGFLNIYFHIFFWAEYLTKVIKLSFKYGSNKVSKKNYNIEFVSANPTGPLHVGHCRGAVLGDALSNLLSFNGNKVTKEYYVNDYGGQIKNFVSSVNYRILEIVENKSFPKDKDLYPGDYIIDIAKKIIKNKSIRDFSNFEKIYKKLSSESLKYSMKLIMNNLNLLGVKHNNFVYESNLIDKKMVSKIIKKLEKKNYIYKGKLDSPKGEQTKDWKIRDQLLFKSTMFGDDADRPLQKEDGTWTYFAGDMAYHSHKVERKFDILINVLGSDHAGYTKRIESATKAISNNKVDLICKVSQLVKLFKNGEPLKMSKRSGDYITVEDLIKEVGKDSTRFMMLSRSNDVELDFDFEKVTEKSKDNPVFYVQYAFARINSIFRVLKLDISKNIKLNKKEFDPNAHEIEILKKISEWPKCIEISLTKLEPHRITFYLYDLATLFHSYWNLGSKNKDFRFISENKSIKNSRLILLQALSIVIKNGMSILGVSTPKSM
jgi:arginyl-tRNA synthetase|tara:strand:+ start:33 stop:1760 length:1728 start_codon:yes stop_codon:yes gene_type:complete